MNLASWNTSKWRGGAGPLMLYPAQSVGVGLFRTALVRIHHPEFARIKLLSPTKLIQVLRVPD